MRSFNRFIRAFTATNFGVTTGTLKNGALTTGPVAPGDVLTAQFPAGGDSQAPAVQWTLNGAVVSTAFSYTVPAGASDGDTIAWTATDGAGASVPGKTLTVEADLSQPPPETGIGAMAIGSTFEVA